MPFRLVGSFGGTARLPGLAKLVAPASGAMSIETEGDGSTDVTNPEAVAANLAGADDAVSMGGTLYESPGATIESTFWVGEVAVTAAVLSPDTPSLWEGDGGRGGAWWPRR